MKKGGGWVSPDCRVMIVQGVAVAVILAVLGILRTVGGGVFEEWRAGFDRCMYENTAVDRAGVAIAGEIDGDVTEVTR